MTAPRVYLDHNATTPLRPSAREAICAALDVCGNPSSVHAEGRLARAMIEDARAEIAGFFRAAARTLIFTSGGTEALNLALTPHIETRLGSRSFDKLLIGAGEHPAVLAGHRFAPDDVELVALTGAGAMDLAALERALERHRGRRVMLALQLANNETGVVQPVAAASRLVHAAGGFVVCDAVQGVGRSECALDRLEADALVFSAHKFGGPKGVGGVCFSGAATHIKEAMVRGGGQERGLRSGTENVAGVAATAAALREVRAGLEVLPPSALPSLRLLRDRLEADVRSICEGVVIFGSGTERLPNTSCFALPGVDAQVMLMALDLDGVSVSAGSACSSGKTRASHVLAAMGVDKDLAKGAIRVSLGWSSRSEDCDAFIRAFAKALQTMSARKMKPAGQAAA